MGKRILFLSNHFITLYNFRKELIIKLIDEGHEVFISTPKATENTFFSDIGCKIVETPVDRRGINPIKDIKLLIKYIRIMKEIKPDIIFSYTIKPNIYGSLASRITKNRQVNNITGTGATFLKKNTLSRLVIKLYRFAFKNVYRVFFQNEEDRDFFIENKIVKDNYKILPGSGVNLNEFKLVELPPNENISFIFIGRVMAIKGIDQYLECAEYIKMKYPAVNFYVAGFIEEKIYEKKLYDYQTRRIIKNLGFQKDIKSCIEKVHCVILPSHGGEGVPNVLLEAAAMGRICIASNIAGSNKVIEDSITGYLFKVGSSNDLINKVEKFLSLSFEERKEMGIAGRMKVENEFDRQIVVRTYYEEVCSLNRPEVLC